MNKINLIDFKDKYFNNFKKFATLKGPIPSILVVFLHHKACDTWNWFSLYNHMGCIFFLVKFGNAFAYFVVLCLLARWRY